MSTRYALLATAMIAMTGLIGMNKATAQSGSLFQRSSNSQSMTLQQHSWTYKPIPEKKQVRLHDIVTVIVNEESVFLSDGEMDRKKKAHADFSLADWVMLKKLTLIPDPQSAGDPKVRGELDSKLRSEASLESRDSLKFQITCTVVDIRPNGNVFIEGHDTIKNNSETWNYSFSGEIRPDDLLDDNTVYSSNVAYKRIDKQESGHVRDGYRRGWLLEWLDRYQPF